MEKYKDEIRNVVRHDISNKIVKRTNIMLK